MSAVQPDAAAVQAIRQAVPGVVAVYRFGSTATGTAGTDSDVDLAVLATTPIDASGRFELRDRLASVFGREVDLVDLRSASPVLSIQVISTGILLFEDDAQARGRFEDLAYSTYARLNEERRGILDRVAVEGSIYGR